MDTEFSRILTSDIWLLLSDANQYWFESDYSYYQISADTADIIERGQWRLIQEGNEARLEITVIELNGEQLEAPTDFLLSILKDNKGWELTRLFFN